MTRKYREIPPAHVATTLLRAPMEEALAVLSTHLAAHPELAEVNATLIDLQRRMAMVVEKYLVPEWDARQGLKRDPEWLARWAGEADAEGDGA